MNLTVQNLFDQDAAMDKWSTYQLVNGIRFQKADFFGGRRDFDRLIEAQRIEQDPRFLQDSLFQAPISARAGVKVIPLTVASRAPCSGRTSPEPP